MVSAAAAVAARISRFFTLPVVDLLLCAAQAWRELRSRADAELAVDLREVPRDRFRAEAELSFISSLRRGCESVDG